MTKLTISEAARACGVARTTLQRAIKTGRLSLDAEHRVDTSELLRAGYHVDAATLHAATQQDYAITQQNAAPPRSSTLQPDAPQQEIQILRREKDMLQQERDRLAQQVEMLLTLHHTTQQHLTQAQQTLHEAQQRYDRLLEAPRPAPAPYPRPIPLDDTHATRHAPMPDSWRRILAYMRAHPGPQRSQDVQRGLSQTEPIRHFMRRMAEAGLLRRLARGVYELTSEGTSQ